MEKLTPGDDLKRCWWFVHAACGHKYKRAGWARDANEMLPMHDYLEKLPCDNCMQWMTKVHHHMADSAELHNNSSDREGT